MVARLLLPVIFMAAAGCGFADSERCPSGLVWVAENEWCVEVGGGDTETEEHSVWDGGPDGGDPSGLGEECFEHEECAEFDADYCVTSPLSPEDPGVCTIQNCYPGGCPSVYLCCDCGEVSLITWPYPLCLAAEGSSAAQGAGCICQ